MRDLVNGWRLRRTARELFGWRSLRAAQLGAMRALMRGRDALVVLPTGAGKSAVYQVPGVRLDGPTLVVSPLLALQQDQVAGLNGRGGSTLAVRISSAESPQAQQRALDEVARGAARFLFVTPEQLANPERLDQLRALRPRLVAVDEAHCLSTWGHDFRPDYLTLGHALRRLGDGRRRRRPPIVALTATASPPVREDITRRLGLIDPYVAVTGLDRPNLCLEAAHCPTEDHRWRRLLAVLAAESGCGIVYVPTRRSAEDLAGRLRGEGYAAAHYHGGMAAGIRTKRHEEFLAGRVPVMVATSAFGMGIDKPDIRWVVHMALPDSPDSYLQEIGRAGRDGEPARLVLLHRAEDVALQRYFTSGAPAETGIRDLVAVLRQRPHTRAELREVSGFSARKLTQLTTLLEEVDAVVEDADGRLRSPDFAPLPADAARLALAEVERHQTVQRTRIDMMRQFAESRSCRGRALLGYFGDRLDGPCRHCDNCTRSPTTPPAPATAGPTRARGPVPTDRASVDASKRRHPAVPAQAAPPASDRPYPLHSTVRHRAWGTGTVLGYENDRMTVLFDEVGYKTLSVTLVSREDLLVVDHGP
jgi:ATP-dependent DNA helicase RecQ